MADYETVDMPNGDGATFRDDAPPEDALLCSVCGLEMDYKGRGRKPKTHPECKATGRNTGAPRGRASAAQVESAIEMLGLAYGGVAGLLMTFGCVESAQMWAGQIDALQAANATVLRNDPKLLKALNATVEKGGKGVLIGAHLAVLIPVGISVSRELSARRPAKAAKTGAANVVPGPGYGNADFF